MQAIIAMPLDAGPMVDPGMDAQAIIEEGNDGPGQWLHHAMIAAAMNGIRGHCLCSDCPTHNCPGRNDLFSLCCK
jgi:hypothetical protein